MAGITYNPKRPRTPMGGTSPMASLSTKAPSVPRTGIQPSSGLPDFSKPNIGMGPNGNAPQISYNPSAPVAANNPPMNSIGQGLPQNDMYGNPPILSKPPMPPIPEPTLPPPLGNEPTPPAPNPQPPTPVPAFSRQEETTQQRIDRLQQNPKTPGRQERLQGLRDKLARGVENPQGTGQGKRDTTGLNPETPNNSTMRTGDLAELAPPVGVNTYFRDEGKSDQLQARKKKIRANGANDNGGNGKKKKKAGGTGGGGNDLAEPAKNKKGKGLTDKQKKNLKKRPQPGSPARPYINRGVTYNPMGYGGTLRV